MIYSLTEGSRGPGLEEDSVGNNIKCITLCQPFASLIALGAKKIESRSRLTVRRDWSIRTSFRWAKYWQSAVCTLKHCVRIRTPGIDLPISEPERSFGDYTVGRYAWVLADMRPLLKPISATGSMGHE